MLENKKKELENKFKEIFLENNNKYKNQKLKNQNEPEYIFDEKTG